MDAHSALADALKQELVESKRREEQMQTRIVALEGEVQKSRASYQELEGSVTALATHLQVCVIPHQTRTT